MIRNTCVNSKQSFSWCRPFDYYAAQDWKKITLQNVVVDKYPQKQPDSRKTFSKYPL